MDPIYSERAKLQSSFYFFCFFFCFSPFDFCFVLLVMLVLLGCFVALALCEQRYPLPRKNYARETNTSKQTPLDTYVWTYDDTAGYELYPQTYSGKGWTGYILNFNSGLWQPQTSSRPLWQHWLTVCVPDTVTEKTALMYEK
jgi:PhoPQ-activated pathogenicity-related protein